MSNKIALMEMIPLKRQVVRVTVPAGATLYQGNVLAANDLVAGKREIYAGTKIADQAADHAVLVINQGTYEDANGNRTGLEIYPGNYSYKAGDVITGLRLEVNDCVFIGDEAIENYDERTTEKFVVVKEGTFELTFVADPTDALTVFKLEQYDADLAVGTSFEKGARLRVIKA